jgi:hypothetical protein
VPDPPSVAMLICGAAASPAAKVNPTEIHDQIQSKNVGVKSLGILDLVRCNIGHDALYRHAASQLYIRVRHTHPITLFDGGLPGLRDSIRRCHTGG